MGSDNITPEQQARKKIDRRLNEAGWDIQDKDDINFSTSKGLAIREYQTDAGPADYISFVDKMPGAVIEAKRAEEGHRLLQVEEQSNRYSSSDLQYIGEASLPFIYESNGEITRFTNLKDLKPRSREVFSFHKPKTLEKWLNQERYASRTPSRVAGVEYCGIPARIKLGDPDPERYVRGLCKTPLCHAELVSASIAMVL